MAVARKRGDETREMRLFTKVIEMSSVPETSLPEFIARRREPDSDNWRTWDEITFDLKLITDEIVTDVSLRRWAAAYGIPEGTSAENSVITPRRYTSALRTAGIDIEPADQQV